MNFKEKLIEEKSKKFKEAVLEAEETLGLKNAEVRVWKCPQSTEEEIAHCHSFTNKICISEERLFELSDDEIKKTAFHEVAHLLHPDHGYHFQKTNQFIRERNWKPPVGKGLSVITEKDFYRLDDKTKIEEDIEDCNNYQSEEHSNRILKKCDYCKRNFCSLHIKPRKAEIGNINNSSFERETHPCIGYSKEMDLIKRKNEEEYRRKLEILLRKKEEKSEEFEKEFTVEKRNIKQRNGKRKKINRKNKKKNIWQKIKEKLT